jgi:Tol biopolymer transport system component
MDLARGVTTRVTATPDNEQDPVWSPDGRFLAFCVWPARSSERGELRRKGLRAGDTEVVMLDASAKACPESWSRDGRTILVHRQAPDMSGLTAWALGADGKSQPEPLLTKETVDEPQISPDGRWFAFTSGASGSWEVYIEPFRRDGDRVRVSVNGGGQPKWRADGRELFFATPNDELMTVDVRPQGDRLEVSSAKRLFALRGQQNYGSDDFAPATDGQRFLVKIPVEEVAKPQLHIVTNWPSLLPR